MGNCAQRSENFVWKLGPPKARKPSAKQSATKLVCFLFGGKVDLYLLRTCKMLTKITSKKLTNSKNHRKFFKTNTFKNIKDVR